MGDTISVGIIRAKSIGILFEGEYYEAGHHDISFKGEYEAKASAIGFRIGNSVCHDITLVPMDGECSFTLENVMIGIGFHWQRTERQSFRGCVRLLMADGLIQVINIIDIEEYLCSVISSEMSATCPLELLKAHAIISRSWLLSQKEHKDAGNTGIRLSEDSDSRLIRWWDHQDHSDFDVCADDHCQRYQGITRESTPAVRIAINETRGKVLMSGQDICDARFSKCCGGIMEKFSSCWQDEDMDYLQPLRDDDSNACMDMSDEEMAEKWIKEVPDSFCSTQDKGILSGVLNGYDLESPDFYRWDVRYTAKELSCLIREKSGEDYGDIISLSAEKRGPSGRITHLRIKGTRKEKVIGKELEIRRTLSATHLKSSAFIVERNEAGDFLLHGAGWGHGVGLCQIGAAMMAHLGYDYEQILSHYYPGATIR